VLESIKTAKQTIACYETPHRLIASLADIAEVCGGDRPIAVARELTKRHEELFGGSVAEAQEYFSRDSVKGELVMLLAPAPDCPPEGTVRDALLRLRDETDLSWKEIVKQVAKEFGRPGSDVYKESLELR
jgi:16S rRNA (cytidine1402-2'-O)-methyltransferase